MTHKSQPAEGVLLSYQVSFTVSTATYQAALTAVGVYRSKVKSRWRKLTDHQTAVLVLAFLRHDARPEHLAAGAGVSKDSLYRWIRQVITVLAQSAARLDRVLAEHARVHGTSRPLLLDGTCLPVQPPAGRTPHRRFWCAKHKAYHQRVLTLTSQHGELLWVSAPVGARTQEPTQAKRLGLPARLRRHGLTVICDRAHTRLDDQPHNPTVITGRRGSRNHQLTPAEHHVNTLLAAERAGNEHAHAHLKNWRILTRLRRGWRNSTALIRALLVLTRCEVNRRPAGPPP